MIVYDFLEGGKGKGGGGEGGCYPGVGRSMVLGRFSIFSSLCPFFFFSFLSFPSPLRLRSLVDSVNIHIVSYRNANVMTSRARDQQDCTRTKPVQSAASAEKGGYAR